MHSWARPVSCFASAQSQNHCWTLWTKTHCHQLLEWLWAFCLVFLTWRLAGRQVRLLLYSTKERNLAFAKAPKHSGRCLPEPRVVRFPTGSAVLDAFTEHQQHLCQRRILQCKRKKVTHQYLFPPYRSWTLVVPRLTLAQILCLSTTGNIEMSTYLLFWSLCDEVPL